MRLRGRSRVARGRGRPCWLPRDRCAIRDAHAHGQSVTVATQRSRAHAGTRVFAATRCARFLIYYRTRKAYHLVVDRLLALLSSRLASSKDSLPWPRRRATQRVSAPLKRAARRATRRWRGLTQERDGPIDGTLALIQPAFGLVPCTGRGLDLAVSPQRHKIVNAAVHAPASDNGCNFDLWCLAKRADIKALCRWTSSTFA